MPEHVLTGYGHERYYQTIDVLTSFHGILNDNDEEEVAENVALILDIMYGQCRDRLHDLWIDAANAPIRPENQGDG